MTGQTFAEPLTEYRRKGRHNLRRGADRVGVEGSILLTLPPDGQHPGFKHVQDWPALLKFCKFRNPDNPASDKKRSLAWASGVGAKFGG
jgi:hypothetical protein